MNNSSRQPHAANEAEGSRPVQETGAVALEVSESGEIIHWLTSHFKVRLPAALLDALQQMHASELPLFTAMYVWTYE